MATNILGINVAAPISPYTTDDAFATHDEQYGRGGTRSVADINERNAITSERRKQGMTVYVRDTDETWRLKTGITNADWVLLAGSTGLDWPLRAPTLYNKDGVIPFSFADSWTTGMRINFYTEDPFYAQGMGALDFVIGDAPQLRVSMLPFDGVDGTLLVRSQNHGLTLKTADYTDIWRRNPELNAPAFIGTLRGINDFYATYQNKVELHVGANSSARPNLAYGYQTVTPFQMSYYGPDIGINPELDFGMGNSIVWRLDPRQPNGVITPIEGLGGGQYDLFVRLARPDPFHMAWSVTTQKLIVGLSGINAVNIVDTNNNATTIDVNGRPTSEIVIDEASQLAFWINRNAVPIYLNLFNTSDTSNVILSIPPGRSNQSSVIQEFYFNETNRELFIVDSFGGVWKISTETGAEVDVMNFTYPDSVMLDDPNRYANVRRLVGDPVTNQLFITYFTGFQVVPNQIGNDCYLVIIDCTTMTVVYNELIPYPTFYDVMSIDSTNGFVYLGGYSYNNIGQTYHGVIAKVSLDATSFVENHDIPSLGSINQIKVNLGCDKLYITSNEADPLCRLKVLDLATDTVTEITDHRAFGCNFPNFILFEPISGDAVVIGTHGDQYHDSAIVVNNTSLLITQEIVFRPAWITFDTTPASDRAFITDISNCLLYFVRLSTWDDTSQIPTPVGAALQFPPITGTFEAVGNPNVRYEQSLPAITIPQAWDISYIARLRKAAFFDDIYWDTNWYWYLEGYRGPFPDTMVWG